jgi:predicted amidohydrolase
MKAKICVAQVNFLKGEIVQHVDRIKEIIYQNKSADLIVFPELILHGHPSIELPEGLLYRRLKQFYSTIQDKSADLYRFIKSVDARVVIGELQGEPGLFYNAATYVDKKSVQTYRKTHVHWTENFIPGNRLKVFKTPLGPVGVTICFDAAFSEIWRVLALRGAKIIVNISAVPKTFRVDYIWRRLMGAAINNQVVVIYANRPGDFFSGFSAVFDPRGDVLVNAHEDEEILYAEVDLDDIDRWREEEMIYPNRRALLYRDILKKGRTHDNKPSRSQLVPCKRKAIVPAKIKI